MSETAREFETTDGDGTHIEEGAIAPSATGAATIELEAMPVLMYAAAHNGQSPIVRLSVRSAAMSPLHDVAVRATVIDRGTDISAPWERHIEVVGAAGVELHPDVRLRADVVATVEEQRPAQIVVEVSSGDVLLAREARDVVLLAHNQWLVIQGAIPQSLAMLAAFVRPNDPAVTGVLADASSLLLARTGSAALEGYQSGPERVDRIAEAIYDALVSRQISYSDPPASWDVESLSCVSLIDPGQEIVGGQKIRTHAQVLGEHFATCLDSTLLFAACLEQAGVAPLVWMPQGHAFVGYWRDEEATAPPVTVAPEYIGTEREGDIFNALLNAVDVGRMSVVETTALARAASVPSFADAVRIATATRIKGEVKGFIGVVDIRACRRQGIVPTPVLRQRPDGTIEVVEYRAAAVVLQQRERIAGPAGKVQSDVPPRVQQWKNTLLDLSLRNQLINFRSSASSLRLIPPEGALPWIEDKLHEHQSFTLLPFDGADGLQRIRGVGVVDDESQQVLLRLMTETWALLTDVSEERYLARLRGLRYKARAIVQESGANSLYLALGALIWSTGGKEVSSPLILVPVTIDAGKRGSAYRIVLDEAGMSTPNYCLLEKLRVEHGLEVPLLAEPESDGAGIDVAGALGAVRTAIADSGLGFRVDDTADLAILQFAKFRLWKDLDEHWPRFMGNPLVKHLVDNPTEMFDDPIVSSPDLSDRSLDSLAALCPIPADASQLDAVHAAVHGETFVLEGPPGTGKSQTITNLLARAVAEGKRVLFVAEKRAALDVVKTRLDAVGLGPFCLDLHDKGSKPAAIRQQLLESMQHEPTRDEAGREVAEGDLRASVTVLSRYRDRLHARGSLGMSLHDAHDMLLTLGDGPGVDVPEAFAADMTPERWATIRHRLDYLPEIVESARPRPDHPYLLVGSVDRDALDRPALAAALRALADSTAQTTANALGEPLLSVLETPEAIDLLQQFSGAALPPANTLDRIADPGWATGVSGALTNLKNLPQGYPALQMCTPNILALPLTPIAAEAQAAASSGMFGRKKRLAAVVDHLRPGLLPTATPPLDTLVPFTQALADAQRYVSDALAWLQLQPGLESIGPINPLISEHLAPVEARVSWLRWGAEVITRSATPELRSVLRLVADDPINAATGIGHLRTASEAWQAVRESLAVTSDSEVRWRSGRPLAAAIQRDVPEWVKDADSNRFPMLMRWLDLADELVLLRSAGLGSVAEAIINEQIDPAELAQATRRGVSRATLQERLTSQNLDVFDATSHERSIRRFATSSGQLRRQMVDVIPADLVDARAFNAGTAAGEVGALQRELNKQRRGLPIRGLLSRYSAIIGQLTPCLLVSPDSIARFLDPAKLTFDLVVFDEASQIRVAESIGAMGRSRAVVVVGDSKQMPPTQFGGGGLEDDDDAEAPGEDMLQADEESILSECVQARVRRRWLSWHYRSQDETLIAFSNAQYYEGRLSSFPPPTRPSSQPAVSLVRVDGHFFRSGAGKQLRTNPIEAEALVKDVERRFRDDPAASIGIVTFNIQQRDLIHGLLSSSEVPGVAEAVERDDDGSLFVKNLENVQGDERDVILFSIAFAKNDKGVLPLNFGPLNRAGGERRLNVAVTRARKQIVVYCSFDPTDLRTESTASVGIAHLRAYLDLAVHGPQVVGAVAARAAKSPDRHRESVAEALRARGWPVRTDVGLSEFRIDLAVRSRENPDQDLCAVLLDGPGWARRGTVSDRDGLPVDILGGMLKWPLVSRIWLPAWLRDSESVLAALETDLVETERRLLSTVVPAGDLADSATPEPVRNTGAAPAPSFELGDSETSPVAAPATGPFVTASLQELDSEPASPSPVFDPIAAAEPAQQPEEDVEPEGGWPQPVFPGDTFEPWRPWRLGDRTQLDNLNDPSTARVVREALRAGVEAEGPIHRERRARSLARGFGFDRVRQDRIDAIVALIPRNIRRTQRSEFLWPDALDPETWREFRRTWPDDGRPLEHVAAEEIGNAMLFLVRSTMGMEREELFRETLDVFGNKRLTEGFRRRMVLSLDQAIGRGLLKEEEDTVIPGDL